MCQHCDTPELREAYRSVGERAGLDPDLVNRLILNKIAPVEDESPERWSNPEPFGEVTLTKGQAFTLDSAVSQSIHEQVGQLANALDFTEAQGIPVDAMVDMELLVANLTAALDASEAVKGQRDVGEIVVPDNVADLVPADSNGATQ